MVNFTTYEEVHNNPEYIQIEPKSDGMGGSRLGQVTHIVNRPSTNPRYPASEGWEDVLYYRYIGSNVDNRSPRNGLGGYVYVLTNKQYPNMCKIGMTTNHPTKRLQQINAAGVVDDWEIDYHYKVARPFDFEQALHSKLGNVRHRQDREFFDIPSSEAVHLINEMAYMFEPLD